MEDIIEYLTNKLEDFDFKKLIFPTIIVLLYFAGFLYLYTIINKKDNNINNKITYKEEKEYSEFINVDIKGSVKNPGVYKLKSNSRVVDAIKEAGGVEDNANTRFINLAKLLSDGDVIVIYSNEEIKEAKKQDVIYVETPCVCEEVKNDACYKEEVNNNSKIINY